MALSRKVRGKPKMYTLNTVMMLFKGKNRIHGFTKNVLAERQKYVFTARTEI